MKTLFRVDAHATHGRSGSVQSSDRLLFVALGNPLDDAASFIGPTPEHLFSAAYAACYHGALMAAAEKLGTVVPNSGVTVFTSLLEDDLGGYHLSLELHGQLPGIPKEKARAIMQKAHETCPYSKALRGKAAVSLVVD